MPSKSNDFILEPNWHLDFCETASLPEDRVVRVRFLINFCAAAAVLMLFTLFGLQLFRRVAIDEPLRFWDEQIANHRHEYEGLQLALRDYMNEAGKIKDAYDIVYSPFVPSEFIRGIGRTLPDRMTVDMIDYADRIVTVRGTLAEPPERASRVLGGYVESLRSDPEIGPLFSDISAPSLDRTKEEDLFHFVMVLHLRGATP